MSRATADGINGSKGAVAAGDAATAEAAARILAAGGSACDAVLAGMLTACVAEPVLCSLGGGGFLLSVPMDEPARVFDFFSQTPGAKKPADALDFTRITADFGTATQDFHIGRGAAAVPGIPAGLFHVHAERGRLPLAEIAAPAIDLARAGHPVGAFQALLMDVVSPIMLATPGSRALMEDPARPGRTKPEGALRRLPRFAETLEAMVAEGPRYFYEGPPGQAIAALCAEGGLLTAADLRAYRVAERAPIEIPAFGAKFLTNAPPSAGGPLIAAQLAVLDRLAPPGKDETAFATAIAATMEAVARARHDSGLADAETPEDADAAARRLLAAETLDALAEGAAARATCALKVGGTTHISAVDAEGDLAALSLSNGEGNGVMIPGTEQMLNNMLGEEDLNPRGFFEWREGTRIASMMAPSALLTADGRRIALGTGGSNRIRSAVFHTAARLLLQNAALAAAIEAPRLHFEGGRLEVEGGIDGPVADALAAHFPEHRRWPDRNVFFGGVHAVEYRADGTADAAGDARRGGAARQSSTANVTGGAA